MRIRGRPDRRSAGTPSSGVADVGQGSTCEFSGRLALAPPNGTRHAGQGVPSRGRPAVLLTVVGAHFIPDGGCRATHSVDPCRQLLLLVVPKEVWPDDVWRACKS